MRAEVEMACRDAVSNVEAVRSSICKVHALAMDAFLKLDMIRGRERLGLTQGVNSAAFVAAMNACLEIADITSDDKGGAGDDGQGEREDG